MNNNHVDAAQAPSIGLDDLLYLFFRHKWKIIFFSLLGLGAAAAIYLTDRTAYRSQAKLLVRYITDKKNPLEGGPKDVDVSRPLDPREASIIGAEAEILRSSDSIVSAIKTMGIKNVLQAYGGGTNVADAAELVAKNLQVDLGKSSGVMILTLSHRDQDIAQKLLGEIIKEYQRRHLEIHSGGATYGQIQAQTDAIRADLSATEDELKRLKQNAKISSLEQSKTEFATQIMDLKRSIIVTEADMAEARAQFEERKNSLPNRGTNEVAAAEKKSEPAQPQAPSAAEMARFTQMTRKLNDLRNSELELRQVFSDSSKKVLQVRQEISDLEKELSDLHIDSTYLVQPANSPNTPLVPPFDWEAARARIASLAAKYQTLTNELAKVQARSEALEAVENSIVQYERKKKIEEDEYTYYQRSQNEIRLEGTIDATRRNNISIIQDATRIPPDAKKLLKKAGGAAAGGIGFGLLMAFLLDFVFNPSVKRAKDVEGSIKVPVIASIPNVGRRLKEKRLSRNDSGLQKNGHASYRNGEIAPWEEKDPLAPYYEALRDRVVMSYTGDLHKPKIVGLTSCNAGAGVSRLAAGLAASLSRDAERNILLVGLQRNKVAVSAFTKGRPADGMEPPAAVENGHAEKDLVAQNLYSLATTGRNLAGASVVQSFSDLLPKLKISEYDYIIFDLPPLTQTSGSLRLASQMERTILVVEAEQTVKDKVKRAKNLLKGSQTNLFAVLNKTRSYGPKSLEEDL